VLGQLAADVREDGVGGPRHEERLRERVRELTIEIDEARQARKVAEITDTDYSRGLRNQADELRKIVAEPRWRRRP
jgi:hypothetical protein